MTMLSRCALIATIVAATTAPAFAQSYSEWSDSGTSIGLNAYGGLYDATLGPGAGYRSYAPALTGGGSYGHNVLIHVY